VKVEQYFAEHDGSVEQYKDAEGDL